MTTIIGRIRLQTIIVFGTGLTALLAAAGLFFPLLWTGSAAVLRAVAVATSALSLLAAVSLGALLKAALKRKYTVPLASFRSTLEDISEGFIIDRIQDDIVIEAEPVITESFRKVIQINKLLLRNVDNLEAGFEEERQAKLHQLALTRAYQRFVPQDFISFLQKSSVTEVKLGDHVQTDMTILLSDIRSFTSLSETMTPEETFNLINGYLFEMEPVVNACNGFIDKYMGDSIMALFHRGPDSAVRAAIEMLLRLRQLNARRTAARQPPLQIGIGLNTGSMMLGIVGGENRMEGTVVSDAVNLSARIEKLNKLYGTSLLISGHTYDRLADPAAYAIRQIDRVQVKGKREYARIYEVFDADPEPLKSAKLAAMDDFAEGCRLYREGSAAEARLSFERCRDRCPGDPVALVYLERCAELLSGAMLRPYYENAGDHE